MEQFWECHGHLMMDGVAFRAAWNRHREGVEEKSVHAALSALQEAGVCYFRDGGDALGVSAAARHWAADYGIDYATPLFAIHRKGHYGGIVGRSYGTLDEYRALVNEAAEAGCDFIKLMFSGIITFRRYGELSCPSLPAEEIAQLIRIAHEAGFAVMAHVNGAETIRAALEAGVDSVEHGYFLDEDCLRLMARHQSIWVPTVAATDAFLGRTDFDQTCVEQTVRQQQRMVAAALDLGVMVAPGSDAGAVGVPHGGGIHREYELIDEAWGRSSKAALQTAATALRERFRHLNRV